MNYIVLDLEWNQAAYKIDEEENLPFEIIEIGAVKLDKNANQIDEFSRLVRPQVYPFLVRRTRELTGLSDRLLDTKGIYFEDCIKEFLNWCGRDYIFCIWGPSDLTQLERNMAYYDIKIPWKYPLKYLDVQKLYALQEKEGKTRRALDFVIERLEIPVDRPFHRAIDDAYYTAKVLQRIDREHYEQYYSVDYFRLPKNRLEETTFSFETYSKFVSRMFPLKEELIQNRKVREIECMVCHKPLKRLIPWFSDNGRVYISVGECKKHGKMRSKIRIKTTEDYSGYFAVRTTKLCTEEEEELILQKRENLKSKRKERRKRKRPKKGPKPVQKETETREEFLEEEVLSEDDALLLDDEFEEAEDVPVTTEDRGDGTEKVSGGSGSASGAKKKKKNYYYRRKPKKPASETGTKAEAGNGGKTETP